MTEERQLDVTYDFPQTGRDHYACVKDGMIEVRYGVVCQFCGQPISIEEVNFKQSKYFYMKINPCANKVCKDKAKFIKGG